MSNEHQDSPPYRQKKGEKEEENLRHRLVNFQTLNQIETKPSILLLPENFNCLRWRLAGVTVIFQSLQESKPIEEPASHLMGNTILFKLAGAPESDALFS